MRKHWRDRWDWRDRWCRGREEFVIALAEFVLALVVISWLVLRLLKKIRVGILVLMIRRPTARCVIMSELISTSTSVSVSTSGRRKGKRQRQHIIRITSPDTRRVA